MKLVDFFKGWMTDSVSIAPWTGSDGYGKETHGTVAVYSCRMEEKIKKVNDLSGRERVSNTTLYVVGGPFNPKDKIAAMPSSYKGVVPPSVIQIENHKDESGSHSHSEIML